MRDLATLARRPSSAAGVTFSPDNPRRPRILAGVKSHRQELWFETPTRRAFINITPQVEAALTASGVREGLCLVKTAHNAHC